MANKFIIFFKDALKVIILYYKNENNYTFVLN